MPTKINTYMKGDVVTITLNGFHKTFSGTVTKVLPRDTYEVCMEDGKLEEFGHWCLNTTLEQKRTNLNRKKEEADKLIARSKQIGLKDKQKR